MTDPLQQYVAKLSPSLAGKFFYYAIPFRKSVVLANLHKVFADKLDAAQIKKLAQSFYSHVARSLWENLRMRFMPLQQVKSQAKVIGHQHVLTAAEQNKGVLILTGHFGNWEFAPVAAILNFPQFTHRLHVLRRTIKMQWIEKILFRRFYQAGLHVIPKKGSLNRIMDALENNEAVLFIMDQHASVPRDGVLANFFGYPAGTFRSLATIAQYSSAPIVPASSYRDQHGQHIVEFFPALDWIKHDNSKQEIQLNTEHFNQILEQLVLRHPEQWLWMHRRWKV
jgi:KDO2-lipid IV(A) lauroyltransferase